MQAEADVRAELDALRSENAALREDLDRYEAASARSQKARRVLLRGAWRVLLPLLDRQKVVRSLGKLLETVSGFAGPRAEWPTREEVLADGRVFLESIARYAIRRRTLVLFVGLLAGVIPLLQIWLVVQQNRIIENQNAYFEIQVYDVVARSMTQGDRNARLMTGALLANARMDFLDDVIEETFDTSLAGVSRAEGLDAGQRRLEDAAFRANLIQAVTGSLRRRGPQGNLGAGELWARGGPMIRAVAADAAERVPQVLRLGRLQAASIDGELAEQVDGYLAQVGALLGMSGRVARSAGRAEEHYAILGPLLARLSGSASATEGRFRDTYRLMLQDLLLEEASQPRLGDGPAALGDRSPEEALRAGLEQLRGRVRQSAVRWDRLEAQAGLR
ncbi:MAG: hypothetical protein ACFCGT_19610 [Sandaracinaceae bacterium]